MITIIDYGVGNLASVQNMLKKCGFESQITADPEKIGNATKLVLPGVGAFDTAMNKINDLQLFPVIREAASSGTFILGICLGAQLLLEGSEEGVLPGLSLIKGRCTRFNEQSIVPLRIPHMGWSDVHFVDASHPLGAFGELEPRFYFTHSYCLVCDHTYNMLATSVYGQQFTCGIVNDNVMGVQFHPEKSHTFGARLLTNFGKM